jgi:tetratricopeptide (TPR) repeat protein
MKMRAVLLFSTLGVCLCMGHAQTGASYDALIQQGKTELQAGNSAQALASGQQAVQLDAARWEAYALAGGALMNLKRYEEAADALSESIKHAPPEKQDGLRALRKQCALADSPTARRSTPTRRHLPGRSRPLENHRDQH